MLLPQEIIRRKRDGGALSEPDIDAFINGLVSGSVTESQAAAFAMAVFFRGMSLDERVSLTRAMMRSGSVLDWRGLSLPGPVLDKHSTGGVGDNVSLMLAPMLASCGAFVPMISGRGLGHTGGTLDKLDSIPGYCTRPDLDLFRRTVREAGCAIIGQTDDLAPADARLYAVRDVTATVESIPLITASILSKKLAAGLDALVMDVKVGNGAFMASLEGATELAQSLAEVAANAGLPTVALLTDMNEPLATAAGNSVEVMNAAKFLVGEASDPRLREVTLALGAELLMLGGVHASLPSSRTALERSLSSGAAAERFERMVAMLGGPANFLARASQLLPAAPIITPAFAEATGFVRAIDTRSIGLAVVALGGGRARASDSIDPSVGLTQLAGLGAEVSGQRPLAFVHARTSEQAAAAAAIIASAYSVGAERPESRSPIIATIAAPKS